MKAGKETLALLISIGLHAGLALVIATMLVVPAPISGGITVSLAGGASGTGAGGTDGLTASLPPGRHAPAKAVPTQSAAVRKNFIGAMEGGQSAAESANPSTQQLPPPQQLAHQHQGAAHGPPRPDHHKHPSQSHAALQQHHRRHSLPEPKPRAHHRPQHHPKNTAAPVHRHKVSHKHIASGRKVEKPGAKGNESAVSRHVAQKPLGSKSHSPGRGQAPRRRIRAGAGHAGRAGKGGALRQGNGPAGNASGKGAAAPALRAYYAAVLARIQAAKRYPWVAQRRRMQGKTRIAFRLSPDGRLLSAHVIRSSGFAILDKAAMAAVRNAAPYPEFPGKKAAMPPSMTVNVDFILSNG